MSAPLRRDAGDTVRHRLVRRLHLVVQRVLQRVGHRLRRGRGIHRHAAAQARVAGGGARAALTLAALSLPGLSIGADIGEVELHYSRYEEGGRSAWRGPSGNVRSLQPLRVESMHGRANLQLSDRAKLSFGFLQDTWSGATPILTSPEAFLTVTGASAYPLSDSRVDRALIPYGLAAGGGRAPQPALVHMMTAASAETRRQADIVATREWNDFTLDLRFGGSEEPDYRSRFGNVTGAWDFNRKLTTLTATAGYSGSTIDANLGPATDWIDYGRYRGATRGPAIVDTEQGGLVVQRFKGERKDWSGGLGLKQVLDKNSFASFGLGYSRDSGFLENPYKLVMVGFADPATPPVLFGGLWLTRIFNIAESRPDTRTQWSLTARYARYFPSLDGAIQADVRGARDDWGVRSLTVEALWSQAVADRWLVTPRLRYYTQSAADFYQPYLLLAMRAPTNSGGRLDFSRVPLQHYSSDHRLSAFGAVSAGVSATRELGRGMRLEFGAEHYVHAGNLRLGGGGEAAFADFSSWLLNVGLLIDLGARTTSPAGLAAAMGIDDADSAHDEHAHHRAGAGQRGAAGSHGSHASMLLPSGLMYAHTLDRAGDVMLGYRYMLSQQAGSIRRGRSEPTDARIAAEACPGIACEFVPEEMRMRMHMLDVMVGLSDRVSLMVMAQFMDMDMSMRPLNGTIVSTGGVHSHGGHDRHGSGGIGDTVASALVEVFGAARHKVHVGLGLSIPTGDVGRTMSTGQFLDYGMQGGSGTWDVVPSATYVGQGDRWFWGGQVSGTVRTGGTNQSGYRLGNIGQGTTWLGFQWSEDLAFTARAVRTVQGPISGRFSGAVMQMGPSDFPGNYGGRYWDVGLGLSFRIPGLMGPSDRIGVEWLAPFRDDVRGYQLDRRGTLSVNWMLMF
jgi:hypothetical protein